MANDGSSTANSLQRFEIDVDCSRWVAPTLWRSDNINRESSEIFRSAQLYSEQDLEDGDKSRDYRPLFPVETRCITMGVLWIIPLFCPADYAKLDS
jgi:hypothetical protein